VVKRRWKIGRLRPWVLALTWVVAFIARAGCFALAEQERNVALTEKDDGRQVSLGVGSILTIRLEAIPGTGYSWQIARNNSETLVPVGNPEFEPPQSPRPGAIQYQVFRFKVEKAGTSDLVLRYNRPWQKEASALKRFQVKVTAR
jgi:predicted secreted protein